eukprot:7080143-Pyramimonas_sp.AAC.1
MKAATCSALLPPEFAALMSAPSSSSAYRTQAAVRSSRESSGRLYRPMRQKGAHQFTFLFTGAKRGGTRQLWKPSLGRVRHAGSIDQPVTCAPHP